MKPPAPRPCGSCPYRCDVPSGVWDRSEYEKLPEYDAETWAQPPGVFMCHQQDGRACAGWVAVHDMAESLAFRLVALDLDEATVAAFLDYTTDVPLFESGEAAAEHGLASIETPPPNAVQTIRKLERRRTADR